jgi:hypothetical protein
MKIEVICITNYFRQINLLERYYGEIGANHIDIYDLNYPDHYIGRYSREYFMTLAEWRDKQINSILDD